MHYNLLRRVVSVVCHQISDLFCFTFLLVDRLTLRHIVHDHVRNVLRPALAHVLGATNFGPGDATILIGQQHYNYIIMLQLAY